MEYLLQGFNNTIGEGAIYLYWSGGMDSTALLYALAKDYGTKQNPIHAVSVTCNRIGNSKREKWYRKQQKRLFKKLGLHIKYHAYNIDIPTNLINNETGVMCQPLFWLCTMPVLYFTIQKIQLCFGYIRQDDIWHKKHEFKQVFNTMKEFGEGNITLHFPLEFTTKQRIITYLKQHDLLRYTSYCEMEKYKPCGTCPSCKRVKQALNELEIEEEDKCN